MAWSNKALRDPSPQSISLSSMGAELTFSHWSRFDTDRSRSMPTCRKEHKLLWTYLSVLSAVTLCYLSEKYYLFQCLPLSGLSLDSCDCEQTSCNEKSSIKQLHLHRYRLLNLVIFFIFLIVIRNYQEVFKPLDFKLLSECFEVILCRQVSVLGAHVDVKQTPYLVYFVNVYFVTCLLTSMASILPFHLHA